MIDTHLRKKVQPIFNLIAKVLIKLKVSPNQITVIAFVVGLIAAINVAFGNMLLAIILLWLSGLLDVLDGSVARLTNNVSKSGAYMDLVFDRMVEAAIILGFYFLFNQYTLAYLIFFISVIFNFSTFMAAGALFKNTSSKSMYYDVGIAERTETFIVFTLMMIFTNYLADILMVFNVIIFITGIIRFIKIINYDKKSKET